MSQSARSVNVTRLRGAIFQPKRCRRKSYRNKTISAFTAIGGLVRKCW